MSSSSPTPAEREASDAAARAKEAAEQALLPYKWTQTIADVDIVVPVAGNLRGRDIVVELSKTHLKVGVKGQKELIIDVGGFLFIFRLGGLGFHFLIVWFVLCCVPFTALQRKSRFEQKEE